MLLIQPSLNKEGNNSNFIESIKPIEKIEENEENKEIQRNASFKNVIKSEAKEIKDKIINEFLKSGIFKP